MNTTDTERLELLKDLAYGIASDSDWTASVRIEAMKAFALLMEAENKIKE